MKVLPHSFVVILSLLIQMSAWAGEPTEAAVPSQYSIRSMKAPCAYYVLSARDNEKALKITEARTPEQLDAALAQIKADPIALLEMLKIEDLSQIVIGSVGVPLSSTDMQHEQAAVKENLEKHGLTNVPVKVFPRPMNFLQDVRWEFPIASDYVPNLNQEQEAASVRQGLQITSSANITTLVVLTFIGSGATSGAAFMLAVPPTVANLVIDYYVGKNRGSINNFINRANGKPLSALFRDSQISFLFAMPFFLIPRAMDFMIEHAHGDVTLMERFLAIELGDAGWGIANAGLSIAASCFLQALQLFTFMYPNTEVDKMLLNEGSTLSESELARRNTWRIAGFFAITAPIFALANHPASPILFRIPFGDAAGWALHNTIPAVEGISSYMASNIPVSLPHLLMAVIATVNYKLFYTDPKLLVANGYNLYERLGMVMSEYVSEWTVLRPAGAVWRGIRSLFGRRTPAPAAVTPANSIPSDSNETNGSN